MCKDISKLGRITTGVKLINMDIESDITVASIARVRNKSAEESESFLTQMEQEMNDDDNDEGNIEEDVPESAASEDNGEADGDE